MDCLQQNILPPKTKKQNRYNFPKLYIFQSPKVILDLVSGIVNPYLIFFKYNDNCFLYLFNISIKCFQFEVIIVLSAHSSLGLPCYGPKPLYVSVNQVLKYKILPHPLSGLFSLFPCSRNKLYCF